MFFFLKLLHIIGSIVLLGSVLTIDLMMLRLLFSKNNSGLQVFYSESKFIEKALIGPGSLITTISGIIMAVLWFGWPFWLVWGLLVMIFTGITGTITISRMKKRLTDLINSGSPHQEKIKRLTFRFTLIIVIDLFLLFSAVVTMIYKPVF